MSSFFLFFSVQKNFNVTLQFFVSTNVGNSKVKRSRKKEIRDHCQKGLKVKTSVAHSGNDPPFRWWGACLTIPFSLSLFLASPAPPSPFTLKKASSSSSTHFSSIHLTLVDETQRQRCLFLLLLGANQFEWRERRFNLGLILIP